MIYKGHIIWVDDEVHHLKPHIMFLESKGYKVSSVTNGIDADNLNKKNRYDLVLLDQNMPGLDGIETLKKINAKLWIIEDDKRQCEKDKDFNERFIKLSRDVHLLNDERAKIKLEINNLTGSKIKEIKEYTNY